MNKKLQPTLIALALATSFGANATVYKIENIDEIFNVQGTIEGSRSGFGVVANQNAKYIGGASGRFAIQLTEEQEEAITNSRLQIAFEQGTSDTTITNRAGKEKPRSSNFVFEFDQNFQPQLVEIVEEEIAEDDTATVQSYIFGINNADILVGTTSSAAYSIADPDQSEDNSTKADPYYAYRYAQRGMVIEQGVVKTFAPTFANYGGKSGLTAINNNSTVVGYASVGITPSSQTAIDEKCLDSYKDRVPLDVCTGGFSHSGMINNATAYHLRAFSWQYTNGKLVNEKLLGTLAEPVDADDNTIYNSIALDINDAGIAVGRSVAFRKDVKETSSKFDVAVVFKDDKIIDLMDHNNDDWQHSRAIAINNNNLVIGSVTRNFSGYPRKKFFVYDATSDSTTIEFPKDFKTSETDFSSNARAINDNNIVVGNIEVDSIKSGTPRRTHGFYYDHKDQSFTDINEMMTCNSLGFVVEGSTVKKFSVELQGGDGVSISYEADIVVVDVNDIAEDGTIIATALVKLPKVKTQWVNDEGLISETFKTDYTEQVVLDANNNPVFAVDGDGKPVTEQLARAVVMTQTTEQACDLSGTGVVEEKFEREGADFGWMMLILSAFGLGRRQLKK